MQSTGQAATHNSQPVHCVCGSSASISAASTCRIQLIRNGTICSHGNGISAHTMFTHLTPTVRTLLILNLAMYAAQVFLGPDRLAPLELWPLHSDTAPG